LPFGCYDLSEISSTIDVIKAVELFDTMNGPKTTGQTDVVLTYIALVRQMRKNQQATIMLATNPLISEINDITDVNYGVLVILALSSLSVYGIIISG
jgi:NADH:ubiquinone oxidoreductase subunit H